MKKAKKENRGLRFTLKAKLLIIFLLVAVLPFFVFSQRAQVIVKNELEAQTKNSIESDASLTISAINLWKIRNESEILRITDTNSVLSKSVQNYLETKDSENKTKVREALETSLFNTPTFLELVVMDPQSGKILISTNPTSEGKIGISGTVEPTPVRKERISPIFFSDNLDSYTMTIENPLKNEAGQIQAIVGVLTNLQSLKPVIFGSNLNRNQGNIYLITPDGQAIINNIPINSGNIQTLDTRKSEITEYLNHEGKEAIGYHAYLPDLNVIFIDEHEKSVLFAPLNELRTRIWLIASITFLFSILLAYFLIDRFTKPIKSLTKTAQDITRGHYHLRSKISTSDEVGLLSEAFNSMTNSLTNSIKEVSLKNALLESQYNASIFGQISINTQGKIVSWNKKFKEVWGLPNNLLDKANPKELIKHCAKKTKDPETFIRKTTEFFNYKKKSSHDIVEMKDGKITERHSTPLISEKGSLLGRIFFCRDITKEVEVNKTKNEFISLATHQLQTPLTAVRWLLENLGNLLKKDKEKYQLIRDASSSTERVIQLVNDMLNVSRLDAGQIGINSKKTGLFLFLEKFVNEARIAAAKKQIEIVFKRPSKELEIALDEDLISEVILNLLSNSIRFSDSKKKITLSVKKEVNSVSISVKDQGIGISKKDQQELFTKFFRTDEAGRYNTTGSGLGLYVIKKILDACKGSIHFSSSQGKGSTFKITLPLKGPVLVKEGSKMLIRKNITV